MPPTVLLRIETNNPFEDLECVLRLSGVVGNDHEFVLQVQAPYDQPTGIYSYYVVLFMLVLDIPFVYPYTIHYTLLMTIAMQAPGHIEHDIVYICNM